MDFKPLITLIAIVNPLAIVPFFMHYTAGFNRTQIRRTIQVASLTSFAVIAICALFGLAILSFFGISLASFQVGGGLLMLTSALSMINARAAEAAAHDEDVDAINDAAAHADHSRHSVAVVPLTIPLLTGPATMSTVVIYADQAQSFWQHAALLGYGVVIAALTFVCFSMAPAISRVLGKTGINVMTRLMGLILAALSVEVIAKGLQQLFPALAG
jgi:multiple antibiotic resistance protein